MPMRSILQEVAEHLQAEMDVPVVTDGPIDRPSAFLLLMPVGGRSTRDALHPNVAIQAWAKSTDAAESLVRDACDKMLALNAEPFADPVPLGVDGDWVWWQATFTIHALW